VVNKIVEGKLDKFYHDVVLNEQAWVRDPNRTIIDLVGEYVGKLGEKTRNPAFQSFPTGRESRRQSGLNQKLFLDFARRN